MVTFQHGDHTEHVVDGSARHRALLAQVAAVPVETPDEPEQHDPLED